MAEYRHIQSTDALNTLLQDAGSQPQLIFKHSLTCPVSTAALREYQRFLEGRPAEDSVAYHLIEIQKHRDVSNAVADLSGVRHESPQAVLFKDGQAAWNASHWSITAESLAQAVDG